MIEIDRPITESQFHVLRAKEQLAFNTWYYKIFPLMLLLLLQAGFFLYSSFTLVSFSSVFLVVIIWAASVMMVIWFARTTDDIDAKYEPLSDTAKKEQLIKWFDEYPQLADYRAAVLKEGREFYLHDYIVIESLVDKMKIDEIDSRLYK